MLVIIIWYTFLTSKLPRLNLFCCSHGLLEFEKLCLPHLYIIVNLVCACLLEMATFVFRHMYQLLIKSVGNF
jgi:hypothetical protein